MMTRKMLEDAAKCVIRGFCEDEPQCSLCDTVDDSADCVSLTAQTALKLADMLKRLEWIQTREGSDYCIPLWNCPYCENEQGEGHTSDCALAETARKEG